MSDALLNRQMEDGTVIVFSDCHYWPGLVTTAHRALLHFCHELEPALVVANGDVMDGARISKHARIGWDNAPKVIEELETCKQRLFEVEQSVPITCELIWPLGNHDARFETYLANHAPEYAGVPGFSLREHFPAWKPCWALCLNGNTMVKHRWKGGINATQRNVIDSGMNIVTGHLHSSKVSPYTDYNGTRYGVDTGTIAEAYGPQFVNYTELNPVNWRSGFAVLTYEKGKLLWPEHVNVVSPGKVSFRGKVIGV